MKESSQRLHPSLLLLLIALIGFTPLYAVPLHDSRSLGSENVLLTMTPQRVLAIAENDCAPWDGPAFALWIPGHDLGGPAHSWIYLRIWQAPQHSAGRFDFPQQAQKFKGSASYLVGIKSPHTTDWTRHPFQRLKGNVRFTRVSQEQSILGKLDFLADKGVRLNGFFEAKWKRSIRACG